MSRLCCQERRRLRLPVGAPESRRVAILFTDISVRKRLEEKTLEQAKLRD
jgi:hypothetical protein